MCISCVGSARSGTGECASEIRAYFSSALVSVSRLDGIFLALYTYEQRSAGEAENLRNGEAGLKSYCGFSYVPAENEFSTKHDGSFSTEGHKMEGLLSLLSCSQAIKSTVESCK